MWVCVSVQSGIADTLQLLQLLQIPAKSLSPAKRCTQVALTDKDGRAEEERQAGDKAEDREDLLDTRE